MTCVSEISLCSSAIQCSPEAVDLQIHPKIAGGGTLLSWDLSPLVQQYQLTLPLQVQIETSHTGAEDPAAWSIARAYAADAQSYTDASQRVFGNDPNLYYRLAVQDAALSVYRTKPKRAFDNMHWRLVGAYSEIIRRWSGRAMRGELRAGKLLKRIRWGTYCAECRDRDSGVQVKSFCLTCYGTGFTGGFYQPVDCFYGELGPVVLDEALDQQQSYSQEGPSGTLQFLNIPVVYPGDVWVEKSTDLRYLLGRVSHAQRLGTISLIANAPAIQIDFRDPIYRFDTDA